MSLSICSMYLNPGALIKKNTATGMFLALLFSEIVFPEKGCAIFRKSDLYLVALLWKMICNLGDPMSHRHPVCFSHCCPLRLFFQKKGALYCFYVGTLLTHSHIHIFTYTHTPSHKQNLCLSIPLSHMGAFLALYTHAHVHTLSNPLHFNQFNVHSPSRAYNLHAHTCALTRS